MSTWGMGLRLMPTTNLQVEADPSKVAPKNTPPSGEGFNVTFVETPSVITSAIQSIRDWINEPKVTVPAQYYRGEAKLPATDMRPWFMDLPDQLKIAFETPTDPIGIYNGRQLKKRLLCGFALAVVLGTAGWFWRTSLGLLLGTIAGFAIGELVGMLIFKDKEYDLDIWGDYRMNSASWLNSVLVHIIALTLLVLPYILSRMWAPPKKPAPPVEAVTISPYLPDLPAKGKRAGGGGGGGDRSPTPASKGVAPKFAKMQLAPPMAVIPNPKPILPVAPTLLGPPDLKLPQMTATNFGDPNGVTGPPSNGSGFGGGIGSGEGTGIGPGKGGGLGPGEGGGLGGGVYSVGGGVSAPIPIYKPDPAYSEEARKAKYQGTVVLWVTIDAAGSVTDCKVVKPLGMGLDEKAMESVRTWKFKPALRNGSPVPVRVMVEVSFRLF